MENHENDNDTCIHLYIYIYVRAWKSQSLIMKIMFAIDIESN